VDAGQRKRRSKSYLASWVLFAAAGAILIAMGVIYYRDRQDDNEFPPVPTAIPGENQVSNVVTALRAEGLDVSFEITPPTARADDLSEPGQGVQVDDTPLYLFIFPDTELREAESTELDPATFHLASTAGTPVSTEPVQIFAGSNVVAALYGGSPELAEQVEAAIEGLL
jgi:hypothetical protein